MQTHMRVVAALALGGLLAPLPWDSRAAAQVGTGVSPSVSRSASLPLMRGPTDRTQHPQVPRLHAGAGHLAVSRPSAPSFSPSSTTRGFVPRHERLASHTVLVQNETSGEAQELESLPAPAPYDEGPIPQPAAVPEGPMMGNCGGAGCDGGPSCTDACCETCGEGCGGCADCGLAGCRPMLLDNLTVWTGVHGFKDPSNLDRDGSFGFHTGLNLGAPLWLIPYSGVGVQAGLQGVWSDFSGANFTDDRRNQLFVTAGLFRRADWGFQGGLVYDYMRDDWYDDIQLGQIRGELSWLYPCHHEWGFWFTSHGDADTTALPGDQRIDSWEATDLYAFFYRRRLEAVAGGDARFFGGFTGDSDGLIGADVNLPLAQRVCLESSFTYLIPEEDRGAGASENEGWNVAIRLVWYPGAAWCPGEAGNYYRPLLRVADRGTMFVDRR